MMKIERRVFRRATTRNREIRLVVEITHGFKVLYPRLDINLEERRLIKRVRFFGTFWDSENDLPKYHAQIADIVAKNFPKSCRRIVELWRRWHCNEKRPGVKKQLRFIWKNFPEYWGSLGWEMTKARIELEKVGLDLVNDHYYGDWRDERGDNWLVEPLPKRVLEEIRELFPQKTKHLF